MSIVLLGLNYAWLEHQDSCATGCWCMVFVLYTELFPHCKAWARSDSQLASSTSRGLINTKCDGTPPRPRAAGEGEQSATLKQTQIVGFWEVLPSQHLAIMGPTPLCVTQSKSLTLSSYWRRTPINPVQVANSPFYPQQAEKTLQYLNLQICYTFISVSTIMVFMCPPNTKD